MGEPVPGWIPRGLGLLFLISFAGSLLWEATRTPPRERAAQSPTTSGAAPAGSAYPSPPLLIPVRGVRPEELRDTFGETRGGGRRHVAIDIMALRGTPVLAAADGTVLRMGWNDRGGHTIYHLSPGQRTLYYYAHLDGYAAGLSQGTPLLRGQVVGYVGDTGNAAPGSYHLHFEVIRIPSPESWWEGEPVNPYPLLRAVP